jgi:hypothetical protein
LYWTIVGDSIIELFQKGEGRILFTIEIVMLKA